MPILNPGLKSMETIPNEQFWHLLHSGNVSGVTLKGDVTTVGHSTYSNRSIRNSKFKNITLDHQRFDDVLTILDCTFDTLSFGNQRIKGPIIIKKSKISKLVLGEKLITQVLAIDEDTEIGIVESNHSNVHEIRLANVAIHELRIANPNPHPRVTVENSHSFKLIDIIGSTVTLKSIDCSEIFLHVHGMTNLKDVQCPIELTLTNCSNNVDVKFEDCNIRKLTLLNQQLRSFTINDGDYKSLAFQNATLDKLIVTAGTERANIDNLVLDESISSVDIYNARFKRVTFSGIKRTRDIQLTNVEVEEELRMVDTRIDNAKFHNINLYESQLTLVDSSISESTFINVRWPRGYSINETILKEGLSRTEILWRIKESYRQLKVVCENQRNSIEALSFKKHELRTYWQIVNLETWNFGHKHWWKNLGDWLILGTNKLFSDFGQSIFRPLLWLFGINLLLFNRLLKLYDFGIDSDFRNPSWAASWRGLGLFLNFLNPVHTFVVNGVSVLGVTDFAMRIFSAYFIYYFIKASRKFHF
jgi:uncharacterized protein YjbI with pentapeptide repeats